MPGTARQRALAHASMQATRLHRDLQIDVTRQVDVFGIAQKLGLWLMAQPLDHLYGFYLRTDDAGGIAVNSQHPESVQRFTVAHEIGHHVLGHQHTTDDVGDLGVFAGSKLEEAQAQVFAASLLLPLPFVNRVLRDLERGGRLGPAEVYTFSRQTGVSYTAAVWTLQNMHRLSRQSAQLFIKRGAAAAKTELRGRNWIRDARADVWMLGPNQTGLSVVCRIGDEVHIRLPENLSTGHAWHIDEPAAAGRMFANPDSPPVAWTGDVITALAPDGDSMRMDATSAPRGLWLESDEHVAYDGTVLGEYQGNSDNLATENLLDYPDDVPTGAETDTADAMWSIKPEEAGIRALIFVPRDQGSYQIRLSVRPMWNSALAPVAEYLVGIRARPRARIEGRGLVHPTKEAWVRQKAAAA
jgi:Zn-dependent peptidase ImmA (M78 family)